MEKIAVMEMVGEAVSRTKGIMLKEFLEPLLCSKAGNIVVDFEGISYFTTTFFNNSFAALALVYGFDIVRAIRLENINEVGRAAYEASMENAEIISIPEKPGDKKGVNYETE